MNTKEIIKKNLIEHGFDGLYNDDHCGCEISDLIPCDSDFSMCKPGYKVVQSCEADYIICDTQDGKYE